MLSYLLGSGRFGTQTLQSDVCPISLITEGVRNPMAGPVYLCLTHIY